MFASFWFVYLYQPLLNVLIIIYNTIANQNMGWAVVWLTIFLRIALLPLTIIAEFTELRRQKAVAEADKALVAFKGDRVAQREEARKIMRRYHISPWAKVLTLGIQLLVLILLYQVFIGGINGQRFVKILYANVDLPGTINTTFYGTNIGMHHNVLWAGIAALYLLVGIYLEHRRGGHKHWEQAEVFYLVTFPVFTFLVLWYLPMVKSLFILTTMLFSDTIKSIRRLAIMAFKTTAPSDHH
jgi:hypothetical protein